jgi:hypothetical protein
MTIGHGVHSLYLEDIHFFEPYAVVVVVVVVVVVI